MAASSPYAISLPSGGGALQGMGETFSADPFTGVASLSVPIALPSGRNGFQPNLALAYASSSGNGNAGEGWSIAGVPRIGRLTDKGVPVYDDSRDIFVLSGAEELVEVPGAPDGATAYRPRTEGLFARVLHWKDAATDYWEVRLKDGSVEYFGDPDGTAQDGSVLRDPDSAQRIFEWALLRHSDPFGNLIEYEYETDSGEDAYHRWSQLYLKRIRYVDWEETPGTTSFLVSVTLEYASDVRPDAFSSNRAGFEIRTRRRMQRIEVRTHAGQDRLARSYRLEYLDEREPESAPLNGLSLLSSVTVVGQDGTEQEALPPAKFRYSEFEPAEREFFPLRGEIPADSLANPSLAFADLDSDGLPDFLQMNGTVRVWRNSGGGRFESAREMEAAPAGISLAAPGVELADANGDGRVDLIVSGGTTAGYFSLRGGAFDKRSFRPYRTAPTFALDDPDIRLVDLNGDGVVDALRAGSRLECFFSDPVDGWRDTRFIDRGTLQRFPDVSFRDPRVRVADMNGDGLEDVVLTHDGSFAYWPSRGRGDFGRRVLMKDSPTFPYDYDPRRLLIGDLDGDLAADAAYVDDQAVWIWINRAGNGWSKPIVIHGTPPVAARDEVRIADPLGNGVGGVLWSSTASGRHQMAFLDLTNGLKPYLLDEADNNCGAVTRIAYAPSTRFYIQDRKRPETRWREGLPFPVQVVEHVETVDQVSRTKLTTEYRYHRGRWDGLEREPRGFGRVDKTDTLTRLRYHEAGLNGDADAFDDVSEELFSPPTETRMWFHQGPLEGPRGDWVEEDYSHEYWGRDPPALQRPQAMRDFLRRIPRRARRDALRTLRGQVLRTELYARDGGEREDRPYTVTEHLPGVSPLPVGQAFPAQSAHWQLRVFFAHTLAERTTQWERGDDPMTRLQFVDGFDAYGRACSQLSIAVPRGRDYRNAVPTGRPYEPFLATRTETEYATRDDETRYIVDRVAKTTRYAIDADGGLAGDPRPSAAALAAAVEAGTADERLTGQSLCFYDGGEFEGEDLGTLGLYGAPVRTEALAFTPELLDEAYPARPPYLATATGVQWPAEYPQPFQALPQLAGYRRQPSGATGSHATGWWAATERRRYDFHEDPNGQGKGLVLAKLDPLDAGATARFDRYGLLPVETTDPLGLVLSAEYDYRVLQPANVTEPNGTRTVYTYNPLGQLASEALIGPNGEGDTEDEPGTRYEYTFDSFEAAGVPISVRTTRRVNHVSDTAMPAARRDDVLESVDYSDGCGRLIQTRRVAEDVVYDDATHGGAGLPPAQGTAASSPGGEAIAAADGPRVIVSGWLVYDNKGRVVEQCEPSFSTGWEYQPRAEAQVGQKITIEYDPRGSRLRTVNPDGSEERVVYGVPSALGDPSDFEPTPWESYIYDANDNAGRTHAGSTGAYQDHWNTPASATVDALGRTVEATARAGPNAADRVTTRHVLDVEGNLLRLVDALGRTVFRQVYDLAGRPLRTETLDAGTSTSVIDAAGNEVESRDARGSLVLRAYDAVKRPTRVWARDAAGQPMALRQRIEYGDSGSSAQPAAERQAAAAAGRLGKLYRHYDDAGLLTVESYDFKGNATEKVRQVIRDDRIAAVFAAAAADEWRVQAFNVDWEPPAGTAFGADAASLLETREYRTSVEFDALNRATLMSCPEDATGGARKSLRPSYNRAGALERLEVDGSAFVERIAYNARGQRVLVAYSEQARRGVLTRYAYDAQTFRLARIRSERYERPTAASLEYAPLAPATPLQDVTYSHDLCGNVLRAEDRAPRSGVAANPEAAQEPDATLSALLASGDALVRRFEYDPLYRLRSATGRECQTIPSPRPWEDLQRCGFGGGAHGVPGQDDAPAVTALYREAYAYDAAGNMVSLKHTSGAGSWTRSFGMGGRTAQQWDQDWRAQVGAARWQNPPGNRLTHVSNGAAAASPTHAFDDVGNLVRETTNRHFEWDWSGRLKTYRTQVPAAGSQPADDEWAEPSLHVHYLYDSLGQRVKKLVRRQGGQLDAVVYIDDLFEHHRRQAAENNLVHVNDGRSRIATVRAGNPFPDDPPDAVLFQFGDHLGSSSVVVNAAGSWINREEWTAFGETTFGSFSRKGIRFMGRHRSEESGLAHHGSRWYAPWLARWTSCDPAGPAAGPNSYAAFDDNPVRNVDPGGRQSSDPSGTPLTAEEIAAYENLYSSIHTTPVQDPVGGVHDVPTALLLGWGDEQASKFTLMGEPGPRTFWNRGGMTLTMGGATLGIGVLLIAAGPPGWLMLLTGTMMASAGGAAMVWGGTHMALSYGGNLQERQEYELEMGGRLLLHSGSPGGIIGMAIGGTATGTLEGMDNGGTVGGAVEGFSSAGIGSYRLLSREIQLSRQMAAAGQTSYVWANVRGNIQGAYGLGDVAARSRPNAWFPRGIEYIELSHWASQRGTKGWTWLFNHPWNVKPMWGTQHALIDPFRYRFMPALWKSANPQIQGLSRFMQLMPDWALHTGYGAMQIGSNVARDQGVFPGDGGTP
jgi:RHS repeat-associated protein